MIKSDFALWSVTCGFAQSAANVLVIISYHDNLWILEKKEKVRPIACIVSAYYWIVIILR